MEVFVDNDSADDDDDVPVEEDYNEEELYGWLGPDADDEEGYEVGYVTLQTVVQQPATGQG